MPKYKDLTNQKFGRWLVIKDLEEKTKDNDRLWLCQCECGTIKSVRGSSLKRGLSKSCGCLKAEKMSKRFAKNITGQRFDRLVALEPTNKKIGDSIVWKCQCDCGNICEFPVSTLTRERSHSCGCYNKEQVTNLNKRDLKGQRFGKLIVLEETNERKNGNIVWKCQCDCGNIAYVITNSLVTGNTSSCGCINYSIGEKNIESILKSNNIDFKSQYTTPILKLKKFDFALLDENNKPYRLIEFDGIQHYEDKQGLWNSQETLENIQTRDKEKNQYAKENNIPLVRIPYWERDNITLDMILGDKYLVL